MLTGRGSETKLDPMRWISLFSIVLAASACGDSNEGADAGMDAGVNEDAGPGSDAGQSDSGIDCSVIGCGAPTTCGQACSEPCGCCPCAEGQEIDVGGTTYVCTGGCYAPRGNLMAGDECTMTSECGAGLSCCYPCGVEGCANICEPTCEEGGGMPCAGGCLLRP